MGIVGSVICCCSSCAMSAGACCCNASKGVVGLSRQGAKATYIFMLGLSTLLAWILQQYGEEGNRSFAQLDFTCDGSDGDDVCSDFGIVYRISFINVLFFTFMTIGTTNAPTCTGDRAWGPLFGPSFHLGCWAVKILLYVGMLCTVPWLPSDTFDPLDNNYAWVARIASGMFLVLQVIMLIDFGYQWNEDWVARGYQDSDEIQSKGWIIGLIVIAVLLNLLTVGGLVGLFLAYDDCERGKIFIGITAFFYVVYTVLTLFRSQIVGQEGAILPAAVVGVFTVYLSWSATESIPNDGGCRPLDDGSDLVIFFGLILASVTLMWTAYTASKRASNLISGDDGSSDNDKPSNMGGMYAVGTDAKGNEVLARDRDREDYDHDESDNKNDQLNDNPRLFHFLMITASFYMAMLLTNWGVQDGANDNDAIGDVSMWVKIISQWITILLFIWTLVAPAVLKNREFDF